MNIFNKIEKNSKRILRRIKNKNHDFTLISQNCIGGVIYSDLWEEFRSPTINMFIEDENFVKLVENLQYYLSLNAEPLIENYIDPIDPKIVYPKIKIGDIEICCLHYKTCEEAIQAWNRRKERVNLNNIYVLGNVWNLHYNKDLIKRLNNTGYPTIIFSDLDIKGCYKMPGNWELDNRGIIRPNITDFIPGTTKRYYENFFDPITWLNKKI
ncbi:DUF1919 domain-containing protein [Lactobacillus intestinalis]|uniref:DUF1919 domain-containing protein n=4 Tax=Bacillota TaxID=1239 RepID=UPI0025A245F9|nr:DUF1919 domain-containing protein [Lactobacillus intestinalis]